MMDALTLEKLVVSIIKWKKLKAHIREEKFVRNKTEKSSEEKVQSETK